jgi:hypothetical protein
MDTCDIILSFSAVPTGTQGRSTPRRLDCHYDGEGFVHSQEIEHFEVNTEPVGELLAVTIAVRHRHLTDDWYLRYVILSTADRSVVRHFPCNKVVLAKVTLRPGDGTYCRLSHYVYVIDSLYQNLSVPDQVTSVGHI